MILFISIRKMIKKYMCSNFLAGEILNDITPSRMAHRIGLAEGNLGIIEFNGKFI